MLIWHELTIIGSHDVIVRSSENQILFKKGYCSIIRARSHLTTTKNRLHGCQCDCSHLTMTTKLCFVIVINVIYYCRHKSNRLVRMGLKDHAWRFYHPTLRSPSNCPYIIIRDVLLGRESL